MPDTNATSLPSGNASFAERVTSRRVQNIDGQPGLEISAGDDRSRSLIAMGDDNGEQLRDQLLILYPTIQSEEHKCGPSCRSFGCDVQAQPQDDHKVGGTAEHWYQEYLHAMQQRNWIGEDQAMALIEAYKDGYAVVDSILRAGLPWPPLDETGLTSQAKDEQCPFTGYSHLAQTDQRCDFVAGHYGMHGLKHYVYHVNDGAPNDD